MKGLRDVVLRGRNLLVAIATAFAAGALIGAGAVMLTDGSDNPGDLVIVGSVDRLEDAGSPVCNLERHFCVTRDREGELVALYTFETEPLFRERGCAVPWLADFRFIDPETNRESAGWFRANCSGTTWNSHGERVFGPGPRNMDRFPLAVVNGRVFVDTSRLICGDGMPAGCPFAGSQ